MAVGDIVASLARETAGCDGGSRVYCAGVACLSSDDGTCSLTVKGLQSSPNVMIFEPLTLQATYKIGPATFHSGA